MSEHELKTLPGFFRKVVTGVKPFEIRRNDRGFDEGDTLILREWNGEAYTGREAVAEVTYITDFKQRPGYVVMGINHMARAVAALESEKVARLRAAARKAHDAMTNWHFVHGEPGALMSPEEADMGDACKTIAALLDEDRYDA